MRTISQCVERVDTHSCSHVLNEELWASESETRIWSPPSLCASIPGTGHVRPRRTLGRAPDWRWSLPPKSDGGKDDCRYAYGSAPALRWATSTHLTDRVATERCDMCQRNARFGDWMLRRLTKSLCACFGLVYLCCMCLFFRIYTFDIIGSEWDMWARIEEDDSTGAYYWSIEGAMRLCILSWDATDCMIYVAPWIWLVHDRSGGCVKGPQAATKGVSQWLPQSAPRAQLVCVLRTGRRKCPSWSSLEWRKKSCWRLNRSFLRRVVPFLNLISSSGDCWGGGGSSAILLYASTFQPLYYHYCQSHPTDPAKKSDSGWHWTLEWFIVLSPGACTGLSKIVAFTFDRTRDWNIDRGTYMPSRSMMIIIWPPELLSLISHSCVRFANSNANDNDKPGLVIHWSWQNCWRMHVMADAVGALLLIYPTNYWVFQTLNGS